MSTMKRWTMWMAVGALLASAAVAAPPPNRVNYQGVLRDAVGAPEEGDFDMDFWFFDAEVAGNDILGDQHRAGGTGAVTVNGGLFSVPLGSGDVIDGSGPGTYNSLSDMFGDFGTVWMEIRIGPETLSPRVRVEASPYALNAGSLEGRPSTEFLDTSVNPQVKAGLLQLGGNLTVGGEITIEGGSPDVGRVLTSDAVGGATWQELPTLQQSELRDLSDRLGSEDVSTAPFATLSQLECDPHDPSSLTGTLAGSPLAPNSVIVGFVGQERISRPFRYLVELRSSTADLVSLGDTFQMTLDPGGTSALLDFPAGEVTEAGVAGYSDGYYTYVIAVEPVLARLAGERRFRGFFDVTWSDAVNQMMGDYGITFDGSATSYEYEQLIQYEESDLDFLHRISALEGYHYHFDDDGTPLYRLGSDFTAPLIAYRYYGGEPGPATRQYIATFQPRDRDFTSTTTIAGWDVAAKSRVTSSEFVDNPAFPNRESRTFYGDVADHQLAGTRAMAARAREQSARFEIAGTGTAAGLRAGRIFTVYDQTDAEEADGDYYVTQILHYATQDAAGTCVSYGNAFTALPKGTTAVSPDPNGIPYSPPLEPLPPAVRGPIVGLVTNNTTEDPLGLSRVKVGLLPAPEAEPVEVWARVATPVDRWRDKLVIPEVDDEVLVIFLRDEPNAPVVIGGLYNGVDVPFPEKRLYFRTLETGLDDPEGAWIEWNDTLSRFELGRAGMPTEPALHVPGHIDAGGNITGGGSLTVPGTISGTNLSASNQITGPSLNITGTLSGTILSASTQITGPLLTISGPMFGGSSLTLPGPIMLGGATISESAGLAQLSGGLDVAGQITANAVNLDLGASLTNATSYARLATGGDLNTDDLYLEAGNTSDDGEIAIFGDNVMRFRAGNGYFNFYNAATGLRTAELRPDGGFRIRGTLSELVSLDIAESFLAGEPLEPGDLVSLDPGSGGEVRRTRMVGDPMLLGVVSTRPGIVLGGAPFDVAGLRETWGDRMAELYETERAALRERVLAERPALAESFERVELSTEREELDTKTVSLDAEQLRVLDEVESLCLERFHAERFVPVALAGRVPIKVDASFGAIRPGDLLTSSPVPGVAMRSDGSGPTVGTALEGVPSGRGKVLVFVHRGGMGSAPGATTVGDDTEASPSGGAGTIALAETPASAAGAAAGPIAPFTVRAESTDEELLRVDSEGNLFLRGAVQPASMDLAEYFPLSEPAEAGDLLVVDRDEPGRYRLARSAHDPAVVGIVSADPGVLLGAGVARIAQADDELAAVLEEARAIGDEEQENLAWAQLQTRFRETHAPVALSGTVPCKVDAGFGPISPGDLLATSPTPGHAMRASEAIPGTIVGKALEELETGTGVIRVLVMMH